MSTVTLSIGPKSYTIACADGEEAHVKALGGIIAEKYAQLGTARAPLEAQNLLFAALFLADELAEARKQQATAPAPERAAAPAADAEAVEALRTAIAQLENDLAAARSVSPTPSPAPATSQADPRLAELLEDLADRIEANAAALEAAAASA
jgi:cell division protein ZapA